MDINEIVSLKNAQPFVPFQLRLADGLVFEVKHPDFIARSPLGRCVTLFDTEGVHILDTRLIAELRPPDLSVSSE
jgi:hypothetical protein